MKKVHVVARGALAIAMPPTKKGHVSKRVQGGHEPVAFRSRTTSWASANKWAKAPEYAVWLD